MHVAAQQLSRCEHCQMGLWMVLRETTVCFIATSLPPSFFIFLPSPNPVRYKTNSVAVKKCAGSFFCWCLLTSEPREFGYLQKFRLWLLEICTLWFLSLPLYVLDVHTAADELEGGDVVLCFRLAIYETEFKGTEYFGHTCEYSYVNVCLSCSKQGFYWGFWRVLSVADSASGQNQNAGFAKVLKAWGDEATSDGSL